LPYCTDMIAARELCHLRANQYVSQTRTMWNRSITA